jgi:hypothetical protein
MPERSRSAVKCFATRVRKRSKPSSKLCCDSPTISATRAFRKYPRVKTSVFPETNAEYASEFVDEDIEQAALGEFFGLLARVWSRFSKIPLI